MAVIDKPDNAVPPAETLLAGALNVMEITFRTAIAADSIARIRKSLLNVLIGAGTLLSTAHEQRAVDTSTQFGVPPGLEFSSGSGGRLVDGRGKQLN